MTKIWRGVLLLILVVAAFSFFAIGPVIGHTTPGSSAPGEYVTVYLHATARLEGPEFTLGEVASVVSTDPSRVQALRRLSLGPTPARPTLLPATVIQSRIVPVTERVVVIGERSALLPAKTIPKDQQWFYAALLAFVESRDTWKQGRIEIELLNTPLLLEGLQGLRSGGAAMAAGWEDRIVFDAPASPYSSGYRSSFTGMAVPAGTLQVSFKVLAAGPNAAGSIAAGPNATGLNATGPDPSRSGTLEGSVRIWIHHFLPIARAAIDLAANQNLTEDVLIFGEEDVSLLRSSFVVQGEPVEGYKTVASLRRGERIEGERLLRVPAVRAGDRVMITFTRPGLMVRVPGRAFRSGSIGDLIDVRPESTSKRIQARIAAKGEVFVESY